MTICARCHRPLVTPRPSGMGRVCEKKTAPPPEHERDLFGYDLDKAQAFALFCVQARIEILAWQAEQAIRAAFRAAREELWQRSRA